MIRRPKIGQFDLSTPCVDAGRLEENHQIADIVASCHAWCNSQVMSAVDTMQIIWLKLAKYAT